MVQRVLHEGARPAHVAQGVGSVSGPSTSGCDDGGPKGRLASAIGPAGGIARRGAGPARCAGGFSSSAASAGVRCGSPPSSGTVVVTQRRLGLARLRRLAPPQPVVRYERAHPGELVHLDIKKLGRIGRVGHRIHGDHAIRARGIGWEYVHVCVDNATRLAYTEVLADEYGATAAGFLRRAAAWLTPRACRASSG